MTIKAEITGLTDYPAIRRLAAALHRFTSDGRGAAIMIGAGFSRSGAHHISGKKMPLWDAFCRKLVGELDPSHIDAKVSDPLRVAEEYRAYFGQAALNAQIRSQIEDDKWRPGELYTKLLKLPWSEVLTTNWDTLLERSANEVHDPFYTTVTKPSDFAWAPSPRIVKLHGSIGSTEKFIVAQEDYRKYPIDSAPFVNFARQVFIENELCLLGFSGADPNFLQWAGWVRDNLADHARKIYLVGALNLSAPQRVYLESINIAPVDLWQLVEHIKDRDLQHQKATEIFLDAMRDEALAKPLPQNWQPSAFRPPEDWGRAHKDHVYAAQFLREQLKSLKLDRETYPGWIVCPPALRFRLQHQISFPLPSPDNIKELEPDERAMLLYEMAWRHGLTFCFIAPWAVEALWRIASGNEPSSLSSRQKMEIAVLLLKNYRAVEAERKASDDFPLALISLLELNSEYLPDCAAEVAYFKALAARDHLDYSELELHTMEVAGEDPIWGLRRAALLMELGKFNEGKDAIAVSYGQLRQAHRHDRYSIPILSRLTWAHFLLGAAQQGDASNALEELPTFVESNSRKWRCDPLTWVEDVRTRVSKRQEVFLKDQKPIEPLFEPGSYRDNSANTTYSSEAPEANILNGLTQHVGIPLRSGSSFLNVRLLSDEAAKLASSNATGSLLASYTFAIRASNSNDSDVIKSVFSRLGVACAPIECVETLLGRVNNAIHYWQAQRKEGTSEQQGYALTALRVLVEVSARLVVRASEKSASDLFILGLELGGKSELQHPWLLEALDSLLTYSLASLSPGAQEALLLPALDFPLPDNHHQLPNPVIENIGSRNSYQPLDRVIGGLISEVVSKNHYKKNAALTRLLPLVERKAFLSKEEESQLSYAIWGEAPNYSSLPVFEVYPHAFLLLPTLDQKKTLSLVRSTLFEYKEEILSDTLKDLRVLPSPEIRRAITTYLGIANAANSKSTRLFPSKAQAKKLFDKLTAYRINDRNQDNTSIWSMDRGHKQVLEAIGAALSYSIVRSLSIHDKTTSRFEHLLQFYSSNSELYSVIPSFVFFYGGDEKINATIEQVIRKSLRSRVPQEVGYAALAIEFLCELPNARGSKMTQRLVAALVSNIELGYTWGLQMVLHAANVLLKGRLFSRMQVDRLREAIVYIFDAAEYSSVLTDSQAAISVSSIRKECAKLAEAITELKPDAALSDLLNRSHSDPLPEVRFS